ncbi:MAG TPA: hypothetical protein VLJ39_13200 [Tepidisphaeraceae bacterium]|nr:hypothetical protein [Tepidisphaeraceae bacterium]
MRRKIIITEEHWPNDAYCLIPNDPTDPAIVVADPILHNAMTQ